MDLTAVFVVAIVFGTPLAALAVFLNHWRASQTLHVRELEAKVRLLEAQQALPSWVDPRDPASLLAWRQAKAELEQGSVKQIAPAQALREPLKEPLREP